MTKDEAITSLKCSILKRVTWWADILQWRNMWRWKAEGNKFLLALATHVSNVTLNTSDMCCHQLHPTPFLPSPLLFWENRKLRYWWSPGQHSYNKVLFFSETKDGSPGSCTSCYMSETFVTSSSNNLIPFPQLSPLLSQLKHLHILLEDFDLICQQQTKLQITEDK